MVTDEVAEQGWLEVQVLASTPIVLIGLSRCRWFRRRFDSDAWARHGRHAGRH